MIKKIIIRSFLVLVILTIVLASVLYYLIFLDSENEKSVYYELTSSELGMLKEGDILLRQGYGFFSRSIAKYQEAEYPVTHCAMFVNENNELGVIHSLSSSFSDFDGVQKQPLQRFLNESVPRTLIVVRYKGGQEKINSLIEKTKEYLSKKIPFDHEFNRADTSKMYCTELFRNIFLEAVSEDIFQAQIERKNVDYYDITTFLDTNYFDLIINHHSPNQLK
jgi:hypothetical protein